MDAEIVGRLESDVVFRELERDGERHASRAIVGLGPYQRSEELFGDQDDSECAGRPSAWSLMKLHSCVSPL